MGPGHFRTLTAGVGQDFSYSLKGSIQGEFPPKQTSHAAFGAGNDPQVPLSQLAGKQKIPRLFLPQKQTEGECNKGGWTPMNTTSAGASEHSTALP